MCLNFLCHDLLCFTAAEYLFGVQLLIACQIEVFSSRKDRPGMYYNEVTDAITAGQMCGIQLTACNKEIEINRKQFYHALVDSMTARLISETDEHFHTAVSFIEKELH